MFQAACEAGETKIVKFLIEHGANVNARGMCLELVEQERSSFIVLDGKALVNASYRGHHDTVKCLLQHGANANAQGVCLRLIEQGKKSYITQVVMHL